MGNKINDFGIDIGINVDSKPVDKMRQDFKNFTEELDKAEKATKELETRTTGSTTKAQMSYGKLFKMTKGLAFKTVGMAGSFMYAGKKIADATLSVEDIITQTGIASDSFQDLRQQAGMFGIDSSEIDSFTKSFQVNLARIQKEGGTAGVWLSSIFGDGKTNMSDMEAVIDRLSKAYKTIDPQTQQLISKELGIQSGLVRMMLADEKDRQRIKDKSRKQANITGFEKEASQDMLEDFGGFWESLKKVGRQVPVAWKVAKEAPGVTYRGLKAQRASSKNFKSIQKKRDERLEEKELNDRKLRSANATRGILGKAPISGDVSGFSFGDLTSTNFDKLHPNMVSGGGSSSSSQINNITMNITSTDAEMTKRAVKEVINETIIVPADNNFSEGEM